MTVLILAAGTLVPGLQGCASRPAGDHRDAVVYTCAQGSFTVRFDPQRRTATFTLGVQTIVLERVHGKGDVEYTGGGFTFWPAGRNNVFVQRYRMALYQNCARVIR